MNYFDKNMYENFNFQEGEQNTETKISEVEKRLGIEFPEEYKSIFKLYNGGSGEIGEYYIDLWSLDDIVDFYDDNTEGEIKDLILFASNGCGMAYAFGKNSKEIRIIPMDSLEYEYSKRCSENFDQFIKVMHLGKLIEY